VDKIFTILGEAKVKTKQQKYQEAVARNLSCARQSHKYKGRPIEVARQAIGIRKGDYNFDSELKALGVETAALTGPKPRALTEGERQ